MSRDKTIKKQFDDAHTRRQGFIDRAEESALLTIPTILPPETVDQNKEILRPYQSLGADGVSNLVSRLLLALFPPGIPWFRFRPSAKTDVALSSGQLSQDAYRQFDGWLYNRELLVQSHLDSTKYRVHQRTALEQLLVVGNALTKLTDDYSLKCYRIDQWVQKRDSSGQVLWLITCEAKDPLALSDELLEKANIDRGKAESQTGKERELKLYTRCKWQREAKTWLIEQELNSEIVVKSEEPVSPFFSAGYIELPGEDYSRSFVEERIGDLRSFNGLSKAVLDATVAMAKMYPVVDSTSLIQPKDLMRPNGSVLIGRVEAGEVLDVGFIQTKKQADLQAAIVVSERIEKRTGKAMLLESAIQPQGERVTATQIMRIARELEGALGGIYTHIAEEIQRPFLDRAVYQMEKDNLLVAIPKETKEAVDTQIITGIEALGRQLDLERLLAGVQLLAQIPGAMERINVEVIVDRILTHLAIDTKGLVKTDEQLAAEQAAQRAAIQQQVMGVAAGQKTVEVAGNAIEKTLAGETASAA